MRSPIYKVFPWWVLYFVFLYRSIDAILSTVQRGHIRTWKYIHDTGSDVARYYTCTDVEINNIFCKFANTVNIHTAREVYSLKL